MSSQIFRLGIAQMTSTDSVAANVDMVKRLYGEAILADLVVFPENSLFLRIRSGGPVEGMDLAGVICAEIQEMVDRGAKPLMLTTAVEAGVGKARNSTLLFEPAQVVREVYTKIHLFDVDVVGAPPVRESEAFDPGRESAVVDVGGWKFGLSICYDLRFSELYSRYAQGVDVILIPSAFLRPTGEAHWQVLVRARAIETQCFVAAPAQGGEHVSQQGGPGRQTYGHSMVVDPWGRVLLEMTQGPAIQVVELNRELLENARRQIPMSGHRRLARG